MLLLRLVVKAHLTENPLLLMNGKADALTRRSGDLPKQGDNRGRPFQEILDPAKFSGFSNPVL